MQSRDMLIASVFYLMIGIVGIVAVEYLRPDKDNLPLDGIIASLLFTLFKLREQKVMINGRMTELLASNRVSSRAEGVAEGVAKQKESDRHSEKGDGHATDR